MQTQPPTIETLFSAPMSARLALSPECCAVKVHQDPEHPERGSAWEVKAFREGSRFGAIKEGEVVPGRSLLRAAEREGVSLHLVR